MSRTPIQIQAEMLALQPMGWALPSDPDTYWGARLLAVANEWSLIEAQMESFEQELDPGTAVNLLADYQRVLGPDPYGWDTLPLSSAQQAQLLHNRWVDAPIVCAGYFIAVAASIGVTITIEEFPLPVCGEAVCGDTLLPWPQHLVFLVTLPTDDSWDAICGDTVCGDTLGGFAANVLQPFITAKAPLWTRAVFNYTG